MVDVVKEIVSSNSIPVITLFILSFFICFNNSYDKNFNKVFFIPVGTIFGMLICSSFNFYYSLNGYDGFGHLMSIFMEYNFRIMSLLSLVFISLKDYSIKFKHFITVPFFLNVVVMIFSLFINSDMRLENGILVKSGAGFFPIATCFIYLFFIAVVAIFKLFNNEKNEGIFLLLVVLIIVTGVMFVVTMRTSEFLTGIVGLLTLSYYLFFQIDNFQHDTLTGVLNRFAYDLFVEKYSSRVKAVFSIDMNDLKKINDTKGHLAGDKALKITSSKIKINLPSGCNLYRIGGDEFVVLVLNDKIDCAKLEEKIIKEFENSEVTMSIGYCEIKGIDTFESAYKVADSKMYLYKKKFKKDKVNEES